MKLGQVVLGTIEEVDYSHGIIYAQIESNSKEEFIEAHWSGIIDLNYGDQCYFRDDPDKGMILLQ